MSNEFWLEALKVGGPVAAVIAVMGYVIISMMRTHNTFVKDIQKDTTSRESALMEFARTTATTAQANTDACREMAGQLQNLINLCHRKIEAGDNQ